MKEIISLLLGMTTKEILGFKFSEYVINHAMDAGTGKVWSKIKQQIKKDNTSIDCKIYSLVEASVLECFDEKKEVNEIAPICEIIYFSLNKEGNINVNEIQREGRKKHLEIDIPNYNIWYEKFIEKIIQDDGLCNYCTVMIVDIISAVQKQNDEILDVLKKRKEEETDSSRLNNLENERLASMVKEYSKDGFRWKMKEIDNFYEIFMDNYRCNKMTKQIVELGYWLTDVYERNRRYNRSIDIALVILKYLKDIEKTINIGVDKEYIQKIIGCAYSLVIPKRKVLEEKERLLEQAEEYLEFAEECCSVYAANKTNRLVDQKFLYGLLNSNYGAWYVNMADVEKVRGNLEEAKKLYLDGKIRHEKSKADRIIELKLLEDDENLNKVRINGVKNRIARSTSNIGGVYFKLEDYENAILWQKKALKDFEILGDYERINLAKNYIVGGYIQKWKKDISTLKQEDLEECRKYVLDMKKYDGKDIRYLNREKDLRKIEHELQEA